jgi:hypothetical protein
MKRSEILANHSGICSNTSVLLEISHTKTGVGAWGGVVVKTLRY